MTSTHWQSYSEVRCFHFFSNRIWQYLNSSSFLYIPAVSSKALQAAARVWLWHHCTSWLSLKGLHALKSLEYYKSGENLHEPDACESWVTSMRDEVDQPNQVAGIVATGVHRALLIVLLCDLTQECLDRWNVRRFPYKHLQLRVTCVGLRSQLIMWC